MDELEQRIYDSALGVVQQIIEKEKEAVSDQRFVIYPFLCDGCFDKIKYDRRNKKFTEIQYTVGVGKCSVLVPSMYKFSGYFNKFETRTINVENESINDTQRP